MKTIKILLAEDEYEITEILTAYLRNEGFEVVPAHNGRQAIALFQATLPQFVILDIKMPLMNGWQVLNEIRKTHDTPVMMLTALDTDVDKIHALRNGADDYIVKPFNPAEVIARVNIILRRVSFHRNNKDLSVYSTKNIEINIEHHQVTIKNTGEDIGDKLTSTEFRLLTHLIRYPKRVFTRQELLENCLPENDANERTVDSHVSKLRKKFSQAGL
ncbi:response regulator, partial [Serratia nevei]